MVIEIYDFGLGFMVGLVVALLASFLIPDDK